MVVNVKRQDFCLFAAECFGTHGCRQLLPTDGLRAVCFRNRTVCRLRHTVAQFGILNQGSERFMPLLFAVCQKAVFAVDNHIGKSRPWRTYGCHFGNRCLKVFDIALSIVENEVFQRRDADVAFGQISQVFRIVAKRDALDLALNIVEIFGKLQIADNSEPDIRIFFQYVGKRGSGFQKVDVVRFGARTVNNPNQTVFLFFQTTLDAVCRCQRFIIKRVFNQINRLQTCFLHGFCQSGSRSDAFVARQHGLTVKFRAVDHAFSFCRFKRIDGAAGFQDIFVKNQIIDIP